MESQLPADKKEKKADQKNGQILRGLTRVFTFLWALASILLILAAVYLAYRGNIR